MSITTIVLAEDHLVVRQGLRTLLEAESDFRVVGEAGNGLQAVQQVERLKPDILVVDLMMPGLNGLEVARRVGQCSPRTHVVILTMHANESYVQEALCAGAMAYILKDSSFTELAYSIREAAADRHFLSPPLNENAIDTYIQTVREKTVRDLYEMLSTREREVLHLAAEGLTNAEIAARLFLSRRTVETHRASLMHKLGLHTQTDLVRYALQRGIIT